MTRTTMNPPPVQRFSRPHPPAVTQQRPLEADDRIELQQRIKRAVFCVLGGLLPQKHRRGGSVWSDRGHLTVVPGEVNAGEAHQRLQICVKKHLADITDSAFPTVVTRSKLQWRYEESCILLLWFVTKMDSILALYKKFILLLNRYAIIVSLC